MECSCKECVAGCYHRPGTFSPDQILPVADYLNISVKQLFDKYLCIDWFQREDDDRDIFALVPVKVGATPGEYNTFNPIGTCIFLKDDKCIIHPVKPIECAHAHHDLVDDAVRKSRDETIVCKWDTDEARDLIRGLYGDDLGVPDTNLFEALNFMTDLCGGY